MVSAAFVTSPTTSSTFLTTSSTLSITSSTIFLNADFLGCGGGGVYASPGIGSNGDLNLRGNSPFLLSNDSNTSYGGAPSFWGGAGKPYNLYSNTNGTAGIMGGGGVPGYGTGSPGTAGGAGIVIFEW